MAKDDYYVIVGKILVYLYAKLKGKTVEPIEQYIHPLSKDFPIKQDYLYFVIDEMSKHNYIDVNIIRALGGEIVYIDFQGMKITQEGIDFLMDSSSIQKAINLIPLAASIFELFQ